MVIIGPGLGSADDLGGFVKGFLQGRGGPVVADADALNALDGPESLVREGETVITPHAGEFFRLTGRVASYQEAVALADSTGVTVLLKGAPTFVMGTERWVVNSGGPRTVHHRHRGRAGRHDRSLPGPPGWKVPPRPDQGLTGTGGPRPTCSAPEPSPQTSSSINSP